MKNTFYKNILFHFLFQLILFNASNGSSLPQSTLKGRVTDKANGSSIPGATIYIADLKKGTISDLDGNYIIGNLPESKIKVQVTYMGFKTITVVIDVMGTTTRDFVMEEAVSELSEIVVTGLSQATEKNRTPTPIISVPALALKQSSSTNAIDAISNQPGINQITTGASISKPVIRGLGYNRVVVVNDGIRQEGQQWGDEHGIEIDDYAVDHAEILKGPASLVYGSDAMAGVINFLTAPTLPKGTLEGSLLANYQTNNGLIGYSLNIAGNKNDIIWDLRWSNKNSHAYQNKNDGYVLNSGFKEQNLGGIIGINKSWGYSHLHFSEYYMSPGIIEGARDSLTGKFVKPVALNDSTTGFETASAADFKSYSNEVPYQKINHYKLVLNNNFMIGEGSLKAIVGWQQNKRKEFADILSPDDYGLYFLLNTINYDFRYVFPEKKQFDFTMGLNGMYQNSQNKGTEFLVPDYHLFDMGLFGTVNRNFDKLDISGGLRFDMRNENGEQLFLDANGVKVNALEPGAVQKFDAFKSNFQGVSGSIGATYKLSELFYTKLNLSRGYRAPNIAELGSNGEHEGTGRYEIGDPKLKPENSLQLDYTFGINSEHVTGEVNLFSNTIDNFIFISKLNSSAGTDSLINAIPVSKFTSGTSNLSGGEISIDVHPHPLDWLHFENSFSYVNGIRLHQPDSAKYLPSIPAPKFTSELKADTRKLNKYLGNAYVKVGWDYYFEQKKIYSINNTETATGSYGLINLGAGTDFIIKSKTRMSFYFNLNNVFDSAYQSHLSRLKYTPENYATNRTGVYEMGRNISFKIIVPFSN